MAKKEKTSWQTVVVIVLVAAMIIGLLGLNIFSGIKYSPAPSSTSNNPAPQNNPPAIQDLQVQTEGSGTVKVVPQ